jgi:type IV secretory pathway VirB2 component (pilin)
MPFREKSAWISLATLLIAYSAYLAVVIGDLTRGRAPGPWYLGVFSLYILALTVLQVVLHIAVAARAPQDAKASADERDRLIELRATQPAFYVLVVGVVATAASVHFGLDSFYLVNGMIAALTLAQAVKYARQAALYRRGL